MTRKFHSVILASIAALFVLVQCGGERLFAAPPEPEAMFARTASQKLARAFSNPGVSYLLYDIRQDRFIASRWTASDQPIPVGSLVKPFTALAYADSHAYRFPEHLCDGGSSCWLPKGHGTLNIARAIALSCNAYFANLAANTGAAQVTSVARRFGLTGPGSSATPEAMAGRFGVWREAPEALVRAYALLLERRLQPGIQDIVNGMAQSPRDGTASAISRYELRQPVIAKTGTAPCIHKDHAPGDGFVIAAWPSQSPHYVLLVRQHGVPGAQASALAARMLHELEP